MSVYVENDPTPKWIFKFNHVTMEYIQSKISKMVENGWTINKITFVKYEDEEDGSNKN